MDVFVLAGPTTSSTIDRKYPVVYNSTASPDVARGKIEGALEDDFWGTDPGHGGSGTIPDRLSLSRARGKGTSENRSGRGIFW